MRFKNISKLNPALLWAENFKTKVLCGRCNTKHFAPQIKVTKDIDDVMDTVPYMILQSSHSNPTVISWVSCSHLTDIFQGILQQAEVELKLTQAEAVRL